VELQQVAAVQQYSLWQQMAIQHQLQSYQKGLQQEQKQYNPMQ
jgi:hypothetical protein